MKKLLLVLFVSFQSCWFIQPSSRSYVPSINQQALVLYEGKIHPTSTNPYEILGVHETSSPQNIAACYRTLALLNHPDKGGDHKSMDRINEAYEQLGKGSSYIRPYEVERHRKEQIKKEYDLWQREKEIKKIVAPIGVGVFFCGVGYCIQYYSSKI